MKKWLAVLAVLVLAVGLAVPVHAGNGHGNGGGNGNGHDKEHGPGNGNGNGNGNGDTGSTTESCELNANNWIEALDGTIVGFLGNPNKQKSNQKFVMETADGEVKVNTAPWWFMQAQAFGLEVEDEVTVSGWMCTEDDEDQPTLIAMSITKGEETIYLRDGLGHPLWSGARAVPGCGQNPDRYVLPDYEGDELELTGVTGELYLDCLVNGTYPSFMVDLFGEDADGNPTVTTLVLGPQWYLEYQRFTLDADTEVTVTGVLVEVDEDTSVFLVRRMETADAVLVFRDEDGVPNWQTVRPITP